MNTQRTTSWNKIGRCAPLFLLLTLLCIPAQAAPGNTSKSLLLGQSCALSGPAKNLGLKMRAGLLAALAEINAAGGVKGQTVRLYSRDDGYEPDRAIKNTLELIRDDQVFMLIGEVGTPTSKAVLPLVEQYKIPFFAPLTGAELLRTPSNPYVVNIRASYYQEMESLVSYLTDSLQLRKISCFYQNDSYGFSGLEGIQLALEKRGLQLVSAGSYERNTVAVMGSLQDIYKETPEAVILVGTYAACAEFIKLSKARKPGKRIYGNISFVGTKSLKDALGAYGEDVIVSQVVPFPWDDKIPLVREYQAAMHKYQRNHPTGFISLEGYIAGKLFATIAEAVPGELTPENFIHTLQQIGSFDLGGVVLHFSKKNHHGIGTVELTRIFPTIQRLNSAE